MTEETLVESQASPELQKEAEAMGWIPPARFRGDVDRFVDAEEYIKRGETVLPIVKEQNRRLHSEVAELRTKSATQESALAAATKAIEEIEERHSVETAKAVEAAKRQLKAQLAQASEAGDHDAVAEITSRMVDLKAADDKAKAEKPAAAVVVTKPETYEAPPELKAWNARNEWFGTNKRKTALALAIAQELRDGGETSVGEIFFDKIAVEVNKELGIAEPRGDKVEGGRNGSGDDARSGARGGKGFANLPPEAKQACDADSKKFVGEGKRYKTQQEWRTRYAELYFEQGA
jgi:hypothetical protein